MKRLPIFLNHVVYNLRGGFLVRPLIIALVLGLAGMIMAMVEESRPPLQVGVPGTNFPLHLEPQVAQVILSSIATSMMTVVSIVFAILLMSLTLASQQYSPRIIVSLARDNITQQTLGIFLGTFLYCLAALPAAHATPHPFAPLVTVAGSMVLSVACVVCLLYFIHHISQAISANHIVDTIAGETEVIIDQMMPLPLRPSRLTDSTDPPADPNEVPVLSTVSGYVRFINIGELSRLAKQNNVRVRVTRRVGHFVPEGVPLLTVSKEERLTPAFALALRDTFDIGPTRTLQQDIEFGILLIVDIALKAISPAVNDPSTAISCVDQLSRILIRFASREPQGAIFYDPPGVVRVSITWLGFDRLIETAFEQIRLYAKSDVAVSLRLLRALQDIATGVSDPGYRQTLLRQGQRIVAGCAEQLGETEMAEIRTRLRALETATAD